VLLCVRKQKPGIIPGYKKPALSASIEGKAVATTILCSGTQLEPTRTGPRTTNLNSLVPASKAPYVIILDTHTHTPVALGGRQRRPGAAGGPGGGHQRRRHRRTQHRAGGVTRWGGQDLGPRMDGSFLMQGDEIHVDISCRLFTFVYSGKE